MAINNNVDKCYTLQVYFGWQTRPDTYICSASAQNAALKVVGFLEVRTLGGAVHTSTSILYDTLSALTIMCQVTKKEKKD